MWESRRGAQRFASAAARPSFSALPKAAPIARPLFPSAVKSAPSALKAAFAALPRNAGAVRRILVPSQPTGRVVIYVQDVHGNAEAQNNIAAAVKAAAEALPLSALALEGDAGPIDVEAFRGFPDAAIKDRVGARMIDEGLMSGPIRAAWSAPQGGYPVVGVDSEALYAANVGAYLSSRGRRDALKARWTAESASLAAKKAGAFNAELAAFDAAADAFRTGRLPLTDYVAALHQRVPGAGPQMARFVAAARLEKTLDFERVERERAALLERLVEKLSDEQSKALMNLGLAYRSGALGAAEFNAALTSMCAAAGVDLGAYREMNDYLSYVHLSDQLDVEKLFREMTAAEERVYGRLARTTTERRLVREGKALSLAGKLLDFSLTRDEWAEYGNLRAALAGWDLGAFEDFYRFAEARDRALAAGVLATLNGPGSNVAVVVTGGFHGAGLERRLLDAGVSVIRFTPKVTRVESESAVEALSVFAQEKTPLEDLFEGRALFLSPRPLPMHGRRVAGLRLSAALTLAAGRADQARQWLARALPWTAIDIEPSERVVKISGQESVPGGAPVAFAVSVDNGDIAVDGRAPSAFLTALRDRLPEAAVVRPALETAALAAAHALFVATFPGSAELAPLLIGFVFAILHPSVYERAPGRPFSLSATFSRFLALWAMGSIFVLALEGPYGALGSFALHAAYNAAIVGARASVEIRPAGRSWSERLAAAVAALPLAMVRRNPLSRTFRVERTNSVEKIVKGAVLKIDGALYAPAPAAAAARPARTLQDDEIDAELARPRATVDAMIVNAETSADPAEFEIAEKVLMFQSRESEAIAAEIREKKIPAGAAVRNVVALRLADPRVQEKPALRESYEFGLNLADALDAAEPAPAERELDDAEVEREAGKAYAKVQEMITKAGDTGDAAEFEIAEKVLMFHSREGDNIAKAVREKRVTAAQATRALVADRLADPRVSEKPALRESYEFGLHLAEALEADEAGAGPRPLSDAEIADEVKKPEAMVSQMITEAESSADPAEFEIAEKILMFSTRESSNIAKEIAERRVSAAQAIRDVVARMLEDERVKDKPALREVYEFGLRLAEKLEPAPASAAAEEPADPLEGVTGSVILVVRNPENALMARLVTDPLKRVRAVVLEGGYESKHWSSLLAQNAGVPVLGGLTGETTDSIYDVAENDQTILVDSINHTVTTNPSTARAAGFERRIEQQTAELEVLAGWGSRPSVTRDGVPVRISSVLVDFPDGNEIRAINENADGNVGLFRMEFLYSESRPDEDRLADKFFDLAKRLNGALGIRAIDRRPGDKNTVFDAMPGADKAELTWLIETETGEQALRSLIRSLLKAYAKLPADKKNIKFFVPMVERREQVERVIEILEEEKARLRDPSAGPERDDLGMPFGVMIETQIDKTELESILTMPGVSFVSIGTRDLAESLKVRDVNSRPYLEEIRGIVNLAVKHGKDVSLCGEHTSNEGLFVFVNSLPMNNGRLPSWAIVPRNISRMKALVRALSRQVLAARIKGSVNQRKLRRALEDAQALAREEIHRSAEFETKFNEVLIQHGVEEAVKQDFDETTYRHLRGVTARAAKGRVSKGDAGRTGFDFTLINPLGRLAVSALQYTGTNGNRALIHLARLAQTYIDRVVFSKDSRNNWTIIGAEGHRPGKDPQGTLPVGAHLGFGPEAREMLLLSMESPQGLISARSNGTVLGRVYGDKNTLTPMPDAYMFKIAAAPRLAGVDLAGIIRSAQKPGGDGVDLVSAAKAAFAAAEKTLGRKPRVGVLLRERQSDLIDALAESLGMTDRFADINARMDGDTTGHEEFLSPDGEGVLHVYEYDDWTAGLSFADDEKGLDFFIGVGGTPEAQMSAVIAKKTKGSFAGALVPLDNAAFTDQERATLARAEVPNVKHVYIEHDLVPGDVDDVAAGVAVLKDFQLGAETEIPGPRVRDDGQVEANVLWIGSNGVMPVRLVYPTTLAESIRKLRKNAQNEAAAIEVALGWAEFGAYDKAEALAKERGPKAKGADALKWQVISIWSRAGAALTAGAQDGGDKATEEAIALYESALAILTDPSLADLRQDLRVERRLRRLHYYLRDKALRESRSLDGDARTAKAAEAVRHAARALTYAHRGLETRRRENNTRLDAVVDAYDRWEAGQWSAAGQAPKLEARVEAVLGIWNRLKTEPALEAYAAELSAAGAEIFVAVLFATALREDALDDQGRVLGFLHADAEARAHFAKLRAGEGVDLEALSAETVRLILKAGTRPAWQERELAALPGERRVVRPELQQLLPKMESRREATAVLTELILAAMAKAEMMPALGNPDRARPYLEEAAQYADFIDAHPRLFGPSPIPVIYELAELYQNLAAKGGTEYAEKAGKYASVLADSGAFALFLSELKDEDGRRVYSNGAISRLEEGRAKLQAERAPPAPESGEAPPTVNSLPYYLVLLWNRLAGGSALRLSSPERIIRPGYAAEIVLGLSTIVLAAAVPGASDPLFSLLGLPVTGLAAGVVVATAAYAAAHAAAWSAAFAGRGAGPSEALKRWAVHTAAFLPYAAFAQALALDPSFGLVAVATAAGAAFWHAAFDEAGAATRLSAEQRARYDAIRALLGARERAEGGLSRRLNSILPANDAESRFGRAFESAMDDAARRAAQDAPKALGEVISSAVDAAGAGPILVFVSANGPDGRELVGQAYARAKEAGGVRPVLVAIDPDVPGQDDLIADIARIQAASPGVPSAVRRLGADVTPRAGAFHYEDLLSSFAADPALRADAAAAALLADLIAGRAAGRIVQINASAQPFVGRPELIALILLVLPIKTTGVLLDINAAILVAKQA